VERGKEELFADGETYQRTHHEKIFVCRNSAGTGEGEMDHVSRFTFYVSRFTYWTSLASCVILRLY